MVAGHHRNCSLVTQIPQKFCEFLAWPYPEGAVNLWVFVPYLPQLSAASSQLSDFVSSTLSCTISRQFQTHLSRILCAIHPYVFLSPSCGRTSQGWPWLPSASTILYDLPSRGSFLLAACNPSSSPGGPDALWPLVEPFLDISCAVCYS